MVPQQPGWSARRDILGEAVLNDRQEYIGKVEDIIITSDKASFAVVDVGHFVGAARHNIAIPLDQLQISTDGVVLPGATKEALNAVPPIEFIEP